MSVSATTEQAPARATYRRGPYSEAEVEQALSVLAALDGNCNRAARELAGEGLPVTWQTLARWKRERHVLYTRIRTELVPHIQQAREQHYQALARRVAGATPTQGEQS